MNQICNAVYSKGEAYQFNAFLYIVGDFSEECGRNSWFCNYFYTYNVKQSKSSRVLFNIHIFICPFTNCKKNVPTFSTALVFTSAVDTTILLCK